MARTKPILKKTESFQEALRRYNARLTARTHRAHIHSKKRRQVSYRFATFNASWLEWRARRGSATPGPVANAGTKRRIKRAASRLQRRQVGALVEVELEVVEPDEHMDWSHPRAPWKKRSLDEWWRSMRKRQAAAWKEGDEMYDVPAFNAEQARQEKKEHIRYRRWRRSMGDLLPVRECVDPR